MYQMYWNHNSAYYPWVKKKTKKCETVLDVGCSDGSLALFLSDGTKRIVGIDTDPHCIEKATSRNTGRNTEFVNVSFENYRTDMQFDAVVFVASIHHMNMAEALKKTKSLLSLSGKLLIVGLSRPSSVTEWLLEAARVIPSKIISSLHHMQTSEQLGIKTDYRFMKMDEIRKVIRREIPTASVRYALHYRYLLEWTNR